MSSIQEKLDALKPKRKPSTPAASKTKTKTNSDLNPFHAKTNTHTDVRLVGPTPEEYMARGLTARGANKLLKFVIQRLQPGLSKSGFAFAAEAFNPEFIETWNPLEKQKSKANWRYGSMLLLVEGGKNDPVRGMRNIKGEMKMLSGRLLLPVDMPWGLPTTLPYDEKGVPLKIAYPKMDIDKKLGGGRMFEAGEPLLVLTKPGEDPDVMLPVIDFEGYRGEIYYGHLHYCVDSEPWDFFVNPQWWEQTLAKFDQETLDWAKAGFIERMMNTKDADTVLPPTIPRANRTQPNSASLDNAGKVTKSNGRKNNSGATPLVTIKEEVDGDGGVTLSNEKAKAKVSRGAKKASIGNQTLLGKRKNLESENAAADFVEKAPRKRVSKKKKTSEVADEAGKKDNPAVAKKVAGSFFSASQPPVENLVKVPAIKKVAQKSDIVVVEDAA